VTYGVSDIIELAKRHNFTYSITQFFTDQYGFKRTEKILSSLNKPVKQYGIRVNTLLTDQDTVIRELKKQNIDAKKDRFFDDIIYLKVEGPFDIPSADKYIIADKFAAESVMMGANLYAPGVTKISNAKKGDNVQILAPNNQVIAFGILEMDKHQIFKKKKGIAVSVKKSIYQMPKIRELSLFKKGFIFDQSFPSILVGHILEPKEGEKVLDMCAAPGGKTTHAAQLMKNKGEIFACDRSKNRLHTLTTNAKRLRITNIKIIHDDARLLPLDYTLKFDKIILDPPCTALGHRPKIYDNIEFRNTITVSEYQKQLIRAAAKLLKNKGVLVYSTCTIPFYENESVINYACEKKGFKIKEQKFFVATKGELTHINKNLELCQRFYPDVMDVPGFFIALLEYSG